MSFRISVTKKQGSMFLGLLVVYSFKMAQQLASDNLVSEYARFIPTARL